jgi:FAD:protein FMN transferase
VIAPDPSTAGALATAFSVMRPDQSLRLASAMPNVDFLIVKRNGERIASPGWRRLSLPVALMPAGPMPAAPMPAAPMPAAPMPAAVEGLWDPSLELDISFQIAQIDGFRARRPYVAVWIEDQDKYPVRLIAVWYEKSRYLDEMKGWYRAERLRALAEHTPIPASASGATRPPGKYMVKWDGKDNAGKYVKQGSYTVYIEAAREHGTYQLMRHPAAFGEAPWQAQLPGNTEISSASLDYRKTAR